MVRIVFDSHDADKVLARVELKNPPFPLEVFVNYSESYCECCECVAVTKVLHLHLLAKIRDRISGQPREQWFDFQTSLPQETDAFIEWAASCVRAVFIHEYQECFHVDRERYDDPHPYEREALTDYVFNPPPNPDYRLTD